MRDQRVFVLTSAAFATVSIALILSLLAVGLDLGYDRWRLPGPVHAGGERLVVPDPPAVEARDPVVTRTVRRGGPVGGATALVIAVDASPSPAPRPPKVTSRRRADGRARGLRRLGGQAPRAPAPAPAVAVPAAPQPVAVPAASAGDDDNDDDGDRQAEAPDASGGDESRGPGHRGPRWKRHSHHDHAWDGREDVEGDDRFIRPRARGRGGRFEGRGHGAGG